jgi:hypothetical protein
MLIWESILFNFCVFFLHGIFEEQIIDVLFLQ